MTQRQKNTMEKDRILTFSTLFHPFLCDAICKFPLKRSTYCIFSVDFKSPCAVECGTCVGGSGACRSFVCNRRKDGCLLQEMGRFHTVMDVQRRIEKGRQFICEKCC